MASSLIIQGLAGAAAARFFHNPSSCRCWSISVPLNFTEPSTLRRLFIAPCPSRIAKCCSFQPVRRRKCITLFVCGNASAEATRSVLNGAAANRTSTMGIDLSSSNGVQLWNGYWVGPDYEDGCGFVEALVSSVGTDFLSRV